VQKRILSLFFAAALALLPFTALAASPYRMAGFDGDQSNHTWSTNGFFTRMEARTSIRFTFDEYTDYQKWQTAKTAMLQSDALPDVLFKAELTAREQIEYAQLGTLIDLKPLLAENAPHLWALLQAHPDWQEAITLPDGKIVALPAIYEQPTQNAMWINRQWLDTLGLAVPTDVQSLEKVLQAFLTGDPNGNGKADEIPLTFLGAWDLKFLAHAFGLIANDYNIDLDDSGSVRFIPDQDAYLQLLSTLADWRAQGLMDENGFYTSDSFRTVTDSEAAATYGLFFGPNPMNLLPYETAAQYDLLLPLTAQGKQVYRNLNGPLMKGAFAITSACDDPAALLQWVDVLYTEEGAVEAMAGTQGTDYTVDADGRWNYAGDVQSQSSYILYDLSLYDTGNMPWLFPLHFYNQYENDGISRVNTQLAQLANCLVTPFPDVMLTPAQEDEIAPLQSSLGRYVDESLARFVIGEWDIHSDEAVAAYRAGLLAHGETALVAFWQEIADSLTK